MPPSAAVDSVDDLHKRLLDRSLPVSVRMRTIFGLKGLGGASSIAALSECLKQDLSVLVKHEVAYALGQMGDMRAFGILCETLENVQEDPIVRHEAAEAIGAIGNVDGLAVLQKFVGKETCAEVRETCEIAIDKLLWIKERGVGRAYTGGFSSIDPAPPADDTSVERLRTQLCDSSLPLFQRYRAMFALRNMRSEDAVVALCIGMENETSSALFRHEVAYVLGQLQHEASVSTLVKHLRNPDEHEMVRHEAAEALGSIATPQCKKELDRFRHDKSDIVRESSEVALDITDYITSSDLSYTDTLKLSAA